MTHVHTDACRPANGVPYVDAVGRALGLHAAMPLVSLSFAARALVKSEDDLEAVRSRGNDRDWPPEDADAYRVRLAVWEHNVRAVADAVRMCSIGSNV